MPDYFTFLHFLKLPLAASFGVKALAHEERKNRIIKKINPQTRMDLVIIGKSLNQN